ncbi:helix-turn-helix transcriptional regulator [Sediminibacterium sp.]|jgi:DNA-binding CsgD family transcriptional regulator|uniref:response regulator transcription factor n=1 Tax=Sediminibacterium sp. TaxID=1917865 RepID=UPI0025F6DFAA|nr:helix-turn-helix transcriptional regulator [Sediminibacterium sp.]
MNKSNNLSKIDTSIVTDLPADPESSSYKQYKRSLLRFPDESIYIYSFKDKKLIYADGWEETLGFKDDEITLQTIIKQTDPSYAAFSNEINAKTIEFILSKKTGIKNYSFTVELKKIHRNGSMVPMEVKIGILSVDEDGMVNDIIGRFRINRNLHLGMVMRYDVQGPDKEEFEEVINKAVQKFWTISGKEKEALIYVAKGFSFKEIAEILGVSSSAIEKRVQPLYKRFNVKNLTHLVSFAYENHILP